jgi:fructoselysine 6-phosphate deglycase
MSNRRISRGREVVPKNELRGTNTSKMLQSNWQRHVQLHQVKTIVFTKSGSSPLAAVGDDIFLFGQTEETFVANFMFMQTIVGAVLEQREKWPLLPKLLSSFRELPKVITSTQQDETARAKEVAETFKSENQIYFVAASPEETTDFVTRTCILTEILNVHVPSIKASEPWFLGSRHARVTVDSSLGEDGSRSLKERVKDCCQKHAEPVVIYDSLDHKMEGIVKKSGQSWDHTFFKGL